MKIHATAVACALFVTFAGVSVALGQADQTPAPPESYDLSPYQRIFIPVDLPVADVVPHAPPSRILYLNNCKPNGCVIKPGRSTGREDSRNNTSSIISGTSNRTLAAYAGSDTTWNQIVACVKDTYAQFNIGVTATDPCPDPNATCAVGHWEAMSAGLPTNVGFPNGVAGVSPYSCGVIPNAITFSFINLYPSDIAQSCWTIAQETAHAFGLAHEMLGKDPMTYIRTPASKRFQDETACIGTQGCCQPASECQCGPMEQNSVEKLLEIFGTSAPTPPTITITNPANGAIVTPGFVINATVEDDQGIQKVELLIDGTPTAQLTTAPYAFNAPMTVAPGTHMVTIRATDNLGSEGTAQISVILGEPCQDDRDCATQGADLVCAGGRCVPGPDSEGGLGTECTGALDCASGQCVGGADGTVCTESCELAANACPEGFRCAQDSTNPGQGFCYPGGATGGCLGCSTDGATDPTLPLGIGVVAAGLMMRRRRRKV